MSEELPRPRGRNGGRKPRLTPEQIDEARRLWDARGMTLREIGEKLGGIAPSTVYNHVRASARTDYPTEGRSTP